MSEYVREARLSLFVDTNKQTIRRDFASVADLLAALRDLAGEGLDPFDVPDVAATATPDLMAMIAATKGQDLSFAAQSRYIEREED